jgi:hypothetical protein
VHSTVIRVLLIHAELSIVSATERRCVTFGVAFCFQFRLLPIIFIRDIHKISFKKETQKGNERSRPPAHGSLFEIMARK